MAATPQQLVEGAACISGCIPQGMQMSVLIYQLSLLSGVTDPQVMITNSRCFDTCIPDGMKQSVLVYLMDKAVNG